MTFKRLLFLMLAPVLFSVTTEAQISFPYTIQPRVDTSDSETREVVELWLNYLSSRPDSIRTNHFWNMEEQLKYRDFDFTRQFLYPVRADDLLDIYEPSIISVEKKNDTYEIRTIFKTEEVTGDHRDANPWTILKVYAVKDGTGWKLKNALSLDTKDWKRTTVGSIRYIYPESHVFNLELAERADSFYTKLASDFRLGKAEPFDYYITKNADELGKLMGLDFFFTGYTSGMAMSHRRMLFSGNGSEWYPHEIAHMLFPHDTLHSMMNEGFATWVGGAMNRSFEERAVLLANAIKENPKVKFEHVLGKKWGSQYAAYYTTGAILLAEAYDQKGIDGLHRMLATGPSHQELVDTMMEVFGVKAVNFESWWRKTMLKYADAKSGV